MARRIQQVIGAAVAIGFFWYVCWAVGATTGSIVVTALGIR